MNNYKGNETFHSIQIFLIFDVRTPCAEYRSMPILFSPKPAILLDVNPVNNRPYLPQGAGGFEEMCIVPIAPEREQEAEGETLPREIQGTQQNLPTDIDIWNVILSFKNSFDLFFKYLKGKLKVFVRHLDLGSLLITVECSSLEILEGLWKDYKSGHLTQVAQETLITAEVLEKLELTKVTLKTFISEEEYEEGRQLFMEISAKSEEKQSSSERNESSQATGGFEGEHVLGSPFEVQVQSRRFRPVLSFEHCHTSDERLWAPYGVAVNNRNEIAVTEFSNHRVSVFSSDGTHLRSFGNKGHKPGEFIHPTGITFDNNGNIIVADCGNNRVQVFSGNGEFLTTFGEERSLGHQLKSPQGLSVTSNGNIIVADAGNKLIDIFSPSGQIVRKFGGYDLHYPYHCIQTEQHLIVSDLYTHCIGVFDLEGNFLFTIGKEGSKEGEFHDPAGYLSVNKDGQLMVCDSGNRRIQVFELSGAFVTEFGTEGSEAEVLHFPISIANLSDGRVVVSDFGKRQIQLFQVI